MHRTQSYNEMSSRYVKLPNDNYVPTAENIYERGIKALSSKNNQARGTTDRAPSHEEIDAWLKDLVDAYDASERVYVRGLEIGIPKEIARIGVPVARFSVMRASANLLNWMKFIQLRSAPNAQEEIRVYSDALYAILKTYFPRTFELLGETLREADEKKPELDVSAIEAHAAAACLHFATLGETSREAYLEDLKSVNLVLYAVVKHMLDQRS